MQHLLVIIALPNQRISLKCFVYGNKEQMNKLKYFTIHAMSLLPGLEFNISTPWSSVAHESPPWQPPIPPFSRLGFFCHFESWSPVATFQRSNSHLQRESLFTLYVCFAGIKLKFNKSKSMDLIPLSYTICLKHPHSTNLDFTLRTCLPAWPASSSYYLRLPIMSTNHDFKFKICFQCHLSPFLKQLL